MKPVKTPTNSPPMMGLAEAAQACGVSVSTIRRRREELVKLGAGQTAKGWQIPITALIELGLMSPTTDAPTDTPLHPHLKGVTTPPADVPFDALTGELEALRTKLAEAEQRAAVAEAVAAERDRIIRAQDMALRMLEAGTNQPEPRNKQGPSAGRAGLPTVITNGEPDLLGPPPLGSTPKNSPIWRRFLGKKL